MKRVIILIIVSFMFTTCVSSARCNSDYNIAKKWVKNHKGKYTITKVITISKGGKKGKVQGTRYIVRYPKKVKKGKKVTCYMIEKRGDICAMVACGKVK